MRLITTILLLLLLAPLVAQQADTTYFYADANSSTDESNCTEGVPCKSLFNLFGQVANTEGPRKVVIRAGTYRECELVWPVGDNIAYQIEGVQIIPDCSLPAPTITVTGPSPTITVGDDVRVRISFAGSPAIKQIDLYSDGIRNERPERFATYDWDKYNASFLGNVQGGFTTLRFVVEYQDNTTEEFTGGFAVDGPPSVITVRQGNSFNITLDAPTDLVRLSDGRRAGRLAAGTSQVSTEFLAVGLYAAGNQRINITP